MSDVDIYAVGWLRVFLRARAAIMQWGPRAGLRMCWPNFAWQCRYVAGNVRERKWRAVKNTLNGYVAEPRELAEGFTRCGTGWTKARALRSLARHMPT